MENATEKVVDISVYLPDEDVESWIRVKASDLGNGLYKLLVIDDYDDELERWEFPPGSIVSAQPKVLCRGTENFLGLVAVAP